MALCPDQCDVNGCCITGKPYCGHPLKGALHRAEQLNKDALARRAMARAILLQDSTDVKVEDLLAGGAQ